MRIIVPFAPGGGTDIIARVMSEGMARELGQPVIVDNKPGAGTLIGNDVVAKSAPDGYTLLLGSFAFAVLPSIQPKLPYAGNAAFAPVMLIGRSPNVLLVNAAKGIGSVAEPLAAARKDPGAVTYASFGNATSAHLAGALFSHLAKVELTHVPYRGSGPALTDLLAGRVDMLFATAATVAGATSGGRLRAIAVTSAERSAAFRGVPTVAEAGVPGYASEAWYGLYATGRHAARDDRPAERRGQPGHPCGDLPAAGCRGRHDHRGRAAGAVGGLCPCRGDPLAGGGTARQHYRRVAGTFARPLVLAANRRRKARWRRPALCAFSRATAISSSIRRGIRPIGVMGQDMMSDSRTLAVLAE